MNSLQVLHHLAREGHRLEVAGDVLRVTGSAALSDGERRLIQHHKSGIVSLLSAGGGQQLTRAASAASAVSAAAARSVLAPGAGSPRNCGFYKPETADFAALPLEWRQGLVRMAQALPPPDFRYRDWERAIRAAGMVLATIAVPAFVMGWTAEDLFGAHKRYPAVRIDAQGLIFLVRDEMTIDDLAENGEAVSLVARTGSRLVFRKAAPHPERVPIWELLKP